MIKIAYTADKANRRLICQGHAGYAEHGKDIVCAAVSALVQTMAAACEEQANGRVWADAGYCKICWIGDRETDRVTDSFLAGLAQIAADYPDFVQFNAQG